MTEDELMKDWLENSNNGAGPDIDSSISGEDFAAIAAAVEARDAAQIQVDIAVAKAREAGASWTLIGKALGITRQGAFKRYAQAA